MYEKMTPYIELRMVLEIEGHREIYFPDRQHEGNEKTDECLFDQIFSSEKKDETDKNQIERVVHPLQSEVSEEGKEFRYEVLYDARSEKEQNTRKKIKQRKKEICYIQERSRIHSR